MTSVFLLVTLHVSVFAMMFQACCTISSTSVVEDIEDAFDFELNFSVNGVVPKKMSQVPVALFRSDRHCFLGVKKPRHLKTVSGQSSKPAFDGSFNVQLVGGSDGPLITFMNKPNCSTVVRIVASRISMKQKTGTSRDCWLASALVITLSSVDIADFIYDVGRKQRRKSQMSKRCRGGSQTLFSKMSFIIPCMVNVAFSIVFALIVSITSTLLVDGFHHFTDETQATFSDGKKRDVLGSVEVMGTLLCNTCSRRQDSPATGIATSTTMYMRKAMDCRSPLCLIAATITPRRHPHRSFKAATTVCLIVWLRLFI